MKTIDALSLSTRMFKTRPLRVALTILGVSVGIGAVLFLVSLGYGLQNMILNQITTTDSLLSLDVTAGSSGLVQLNKDSLEKLARLEEVAEVSPLISVSGQISANNLTGDGAIYAVDSSFLRLSGITPKFGKTLSSDNTYEIIISSAAAKLFNFENSAQTLGQEIKIDLFLTKQAVSPSESTEENTEEPSAEIEVITRDKPYTIVGIINDENISFAYLPINTLADLNINQYEEIKIKVKRSENLNSVREQIIGQGFMVSSLSDTIDQTKKVFGVIQLVLGLFGLVALLVSAIGMFNTMTIALLERTNEIGIMRTIGVTRRDIRVLFLVESIIMGFLGGLGGILIGYLGGEIMNLVINIMAKNFGGQAMNLFSRPAWFVFSIIVFSTFTGFLTGLYPSNRAAKLNPLEALRYK